MNTSNITNGCSVEILGKLTKNPKPNVLIIYCYN